MVDSVSPGEHPHPTIAVDCDPGPQVAHSLDSSSLLLNDLGLWLGATAAATVGIRAGI